ncbi:MAG: 1-acyl-sn-glycerol-3-phosphate acyltransferase [Hyphomicrobiaceae bacterium]|nr:MAG: 1-acyl-sn-glycerol-3-phosphate acyltransferase [Hyphomicrobiaceae bacterium]
MTGLRRWWRLWRALIHVLIAVFKVALLYPHWPVSRRRVEVRAWAQTALEIFGVRTCIAGRSTAPSQPCMLVANHVSWLDVFVILSFADARFVAKAQVARWPLVGGLARALGTVFIDRSARASAAATNAMVRGLFFEKSTVCIFPEGTTTDGSMIKVFRAPLLQAAIDQAVDIQPIALRYVRPDGSPGTEAAFTGEMSLLRSLWMLAGCSALRTDITLLTPVGAADFNRHDLANQLQRSIASHLDVPCEAGTRTRSCGSHAMTAAFAGATAACRASSIDLA